MSNFIWTQHIPAIAVVTLAIGSTWLTAQSKLPKPPEKPIPPIPPQDRILLPNPYKVYTNGSLVTNAPYRGATAKNLPIVNTFTGTPGCYVACYSRTATNSVYSVGDGIYVMGQVRVPGSYAGRICLPKGFEAADISAEFQFKRLCMEQLPKVCRNYSCWAGGDTGGWFGTP
ncbi:hypothetical protein [Pantanalinema sp. GBBB05]|uniref:hypothetical protein n=1 Tax=Pantanalinema sp. GBBB05 TaxID=2604139 RepID=UPI003D81872D